MESFCGTHIFYKNSDLYIEEKAVSDLAFSYQTPFYAYSKAAISERFRLFSSELDGLPKKSRICFSIKSNFNPHILVLLKSLGSGADIVSKGELGLALRCGISADKIVFSGIGKTDEELSAAIDENILQINIESFSEAKRLYEICSSKEAPIAVGIRVNPDIKAATFDKISTARKDDKFGVDYRRVGELISLINGAYSPYLRFKGLAIHIGSQITNLDSFAKAFMRLRLLIEDLRANGVRISRLDFGGGLGINKDYHSLLKGYIALISEHFSGCDFIEEYIFEPGRFILSDTAILVSKVIDVKKTDFRRFIIIDAAMNDFMRPSIYGSIHRIGEVKKSRQKPETADIVGAICESSDVFVKDLAISPLAAGDLVAIAEVGAYGSVFCNHYNLRPIIAEILVNDKDSRIIRDAIIGADI